MNEGLRTHKALRDGTASLIVRIIARRVRVRCGAGFVIWLRVPSKRGGEEG